VAWDGFRLLRLVPFVFLLFLIGMAYSVLLSGQQRLYERGVLENPPPINIDRIYAFLTSYTVYIIRFTGLVSVAFSAAVVSRIVFSRYVVEKAIQPAGEHVIDPSDYYSLLGVGRKASVEEIKKAYRRFAKRYHPDVSGHPFAEEAMKAANEAVRILTDPVKRRRYDEMLAAGKMKSAAAGLPGFGKTFSTHGKRVCQVFSAIPALVIALILINSVVNAPSMPKLLSPPKGGWLSSEALISIPVLAIGFWTVSRSLFRAVVWGFMWLALIPLALYLTFIILSLAATGRPWGLELPLVTLSSACYQTLQAIAFSLKQADATYLFTVMNILAAAAMWWDKRQATLSGWRISEAALKRMAIAGGGLAVLLASLALGHKIRKTGFMLTVAAAFIINTVVIGMAVKT